MSRGEFLFSAASACFLLYSTRVVIYYSLCNIVPSLLVFIQHLKTFLFHRSYPDLRIWHFKVVVRQIMFSTHAALKHLMVIMWSCRPCLTEFGHECLYIASLQSPTRWHSQHCHMLGF